MEPKKIFVTGISGCVGHYLYDVLAADPGIHLFLLVRNPRKLRFSCKENSPVELIHDSLENIHLYAGLLKQMDAAITLKSALGLKGRKTGDGDGSFHFIHAHDIAVMVHHLLKQEMSERRLILGNPPISLDQCIEKLCDTAGKKRRSVVNLTPLLVKVVPELLKKRLSPWDLYST